MRCVILLAPALLLAACATQPMGPTVAVMPAAGKVFAVFQQEQAQCKQFANQETAGGTESANLRQLATGALGTVFGAGLGAALGEARGAAIGAVTGALGGTALGGVQATQAGGGLQHRYDIAFAQCMFTYGNRIPEPARVAALPYR